MPLAGALPGSFGATRRANGSGRRWAACSFAVIACTLLARPRAPTASFLVLVATHSAGYFLGDASVKWLTGPSWIETFPALSKSQIGTLAKLSWGLFYGLGFGASLGFTFARAIQSMQQLDC